jgi:hypothetical protein
MAASSLPRAVAELVKVASMGGGRGISLQTQPRGTLAKNGSQFEAFAKNMFAECLGALPARVDACWERTFSWLGGSNNPPDFMIRSGDAVEVKSNRGTGQIQLNSSPPKRTLKVDDPRIQAGCRTCEEWTEKDFLYCIGKCNEGYVEALWLIDGHCVADNSDVYDILFEKIAITISNLGGDPGNELGRLNKVDSLGSSSLRIRGMWLLDHPANIFQSVFRPPTSGAFVLNALISESKWDKYSGDEIQSLETLKSSGLRIERVRVPDSGRRGLEQPAIHISWGIGIT